MATNKPCIDDLSSLAQRAIDDARARKARVLEEAELEQVAGGVSGASVALKVPIIWGLIFPGDILTQSPIAVR
jgi:hypothetical protein